MESTPKLGERRTRCWILSSASVAAIALMTLAGGLARGSAGPLDEGGAPSASERSGAGPSRLADVLSSAPFTHAKHVPEAWVRGEQERYRDCRGCHDYGDRSAHDPQAVCTHCHFTNEINGYHFDLSRSAPGFEHDLGAARSPGALFSHGYHLALECRACHAVEAGSIAAPMLMPKVGGFALCTGCHGSAPTRDLAALPFMADVSEARRSGTRERLVNNLIDLLNERPEMGPDVGDTRHLGPFRHADHITGARLGDAVPLATLRATRAGSGGAPTCASCHGPLFESGAARPAAPGEPGFQAFDQSRESCGTCHIASADRTPLVFELAQSPRPSRVAGTFSHAVHLAAAATPPANGATASAAAHAELQADGCATCHVYDGLESQTFALREERASFAGCQECHGGAPWAPPEHAGWWLPRDHGDWQSCARCHAFGAADFKTTRPRVDVRRLSPGAFRIETQRHPDITVRPGESIAQDCADCHRTPVAELPSRVREAVFQHATHLPTQPTSQDCAACHAGRVAGAEGAAELAGLVYDASACGECHLGAEPVATRTLTDLAAEPARSVVEFSHAGHLNKAWHGGAALTCLDCHAFDAAAQGATVTTRPAALDCTQCHDHGPRALTTGAVSTAEVRGCAQCHGGGVPVQGRSAPPSGVEAHAASIAGIVDGARQFHPSGQDCKACHVTLSAPPERLASTSRVVATRAFYTPENEPREKPAIHRGNTSKFPQERTDCFACHWTDAYMDAPGERGGTTNPESDAIRRLRGDDLRGYPGGD